MNNKFIDTISDRVRETVAGSASYTDNVKPIYIDSLAGIQIIKPGPKKDGPGEPTGRFLWTIPCRFKGVEWYRFGGVDFIYAPRDITNPEDGGEYSIFLHFEGSRPLIAIADGIDNAIAELSMSIETFENMAKRLPSSQTPLPPDKS